MTPLHIAAINKNENVYRLIFDNVLEKYPRNRRGKTPADSLKRDIEINGVLRPANVHMW